MKTENKKDIIAILFICYFSASCFYLHACNSIYTNLDLYIFITAFTFMLILPIFVIVFKYDKRRNING